jgi:hypothetical protein
MVHGFDIPIHDQEGFSELVTRTDGLAKNLGVPIRIVRTNLRNKTQLNWEHSFGASIACVLHQFSHKSNSGLLASGSSYYERLPTIWGSSPATDFLLSGLAFTLIHDGATFSRTEKVQSISKYPIARAALKVCWEGVSTGRNCGKCEKCIRTKLNFLAIGINKPECFAEELTLEDIAGLEIRNSTQLREVESILDYVKIHGIIDVRFSALESRLLKFTEEAKVSSVTERDSIRNPKIWRFTWPYRFVRSLLKR